MEDIFISYHDDDATLVRRFADDLMTVGNEVLFGHSPRNGAAAWRDVLAGIRRCGIFIFGLTSGALHSRVNRVELAYAQDLGKPVLVVLLGDGVDLGRLPEPLRSQRVVDCRADTRRTGFELARAMAVLPAAGPLPDPMPAPPAAPLWHLQELEEMIGPTSALDYDHQCVVLLRLHRALRHPETRTEALTLLERLATRPDLAAEAAEEVDYLLATASAPTLPERSGSPPPTPAENGWGMASELATSSGMAVSEEIMPPPPEVLPPTKRTASHRVQPKVAPPPRPAPEDDPRLYIDPDRGLMWTRKDNGMSVTWIRASEYAAELSLSGYTDWRLPTMDELESLYEPNSPELIKVRPPVELDHRFAWSSEKESARSVEGFDFCYGSRKRCYVDDGYLRVLCVRDLEGEAGRV